MGRSRDLIDRARAVAGLDDLGPDTFRKGLELLVSSADRDAHLTAFGQDAFFGQVVGLLVNRLEIEEWYRRHPEIDDQVISPPLFGLGLPRTGSTALSFLLAQDPDTRSLRTWEASKPCPPPEAATEHDDPRIAAAQAALDYQDLLAPEFKAMLPMSATGPTECLQILGLEFRSMLFDGMVKVPAYDEWLFTCDMEPAYRYHRRVLKLLQWRCPPTRWRLRTPGHMLAIDALDGVYPDARFVMTHRDITSVIPSVVSLIATLSAVFTDRPDIGWVRQRCTDAWDVALRRTIAFRDSGHDDRFFDIGFGGMQADPVGSVRALYGWLGEELNDAAAASMATWSTANPRDKYGVHAYRPEQYGIDLEALAARFRFYTARFGIQSDRHEEAR